MSGSWRTGSDVSSNNLRVLDGCGVPYKIFIHTWAQNIATFRTPMETIYAHHWYFSLKEPIYEVPPPIVNVHLLKKCYPNSEVLIETFKEERFFNEFHFTQHQRKIQKYLNTCAMYYGMDQTRRMLISDPSFSSFKYFLKIRPDFSLSEESIKEIFVSPLVFIGQTIESSKGRVSDQCFGGDIEASLQIMEGITKLSAIPVRGELVFPEQIATTGENPLIEHLYDLRDDLSVQINYFLSTPPSDMIQRPRIVDNPDIVLRIWLLCLVRHNVAVLFNRVAGYSRIIFERFQKIISDFRKIIDV
jgi:hypothetical protein